MAAALAGLTVRITQYALWQTASGERTLAATNGQRNRPLDVRSMDGLCVTAPLNAMWYVTFHLDRSIEWVTGGGKQAPNWTQVMGDQT